MKTFHLERETDPTGVSGTGVVAEGVLFDDGSAVVKWGDSPTAPYSSTVFWPAPNAAEAIEAIHGHHGLTKIIYHN